MTLKFKFNLMSDLICNFLCKYCSCAKLQQHDTNFPPAGHHGKVFTLHCSMWFFHYSYSSCLVSPRLLWLCRAITMILPRSGSAGKTLTGSHNIVC